MPVIQKNISLKSFNTFGIDVKAQYFCEINSAHDLIALLDEPEFRFPKLWLGGGSNMLLTKDFEGLVIKLNFKGKELVEEGDTKVMVSAAAGENWHELVLWTLEQNLGGLENLSLIPGNVGTAPIQNIGAYGVEVKDTFHHLEALNLDTKEIEIFYHKDCEFGYRDSVFKRHLKGKYIITKVYFELTKAENHKLNTSYGAIERELERMNATADIHTVSQAVVNIRQSKLPDPKEIGNSGSFFKNPVISKAQFEELKANYPDIVAYPIDERNIKLAAGWLIEKAGWKGYRASDAGVHKNQALVLVNYGKASGMEIEKLSKEIQASVFRTFAVKLEAEVNVI